MLSWQEVAVAAAVVLVLAPVARLLYFHGYLKKRVFLVPWSNLSQDDQFNTGEALAELLGFELDRVQTLLFRARTGEGLWNESVALPQTQRSSDGYPSIVKDVELLGLPDRVARFVQFVLRAKPQALRGTVQKHGSLVRFQLNLENVKRDSAGAGVRSWATTFPVDRPETVPDAVADLAHQAFRDLSQIHGFKSPDAFRAFTTGLRHHLDYKNVSRVEAFESAMAEYRQAIKHDGGNALSACNLADLLYVQFDYNWNESAIEAYTEALRTDSLVLRARAFRGLANCYCQKYQRYKRRERPIVDSAVRAARSAGRLCQGTAIDAKEMASILKAEAYVQQVVAEQEGLTTEKREEALANAVRLYERAIACNRKFSAAFNNLSYLHLQKAKSVAPLEATRVAGNGNAARLDRALDLLNEAEKYSALAIKSDNTLYVAYDNLGNISALRSQLQIERAEELLDMAIESYHDALSYRPKYTEALNDLAKGHAQLHSVRASQRLETDAADAELAWHYHWRSLGSIDDLNGQRALCSDFAGQCASVGCPRPPRSDDGTAVRCSCHSGGGSQ